jgi:hypothetical protein
MRKKLSTRRAVKAKDDVDAFDALFAAVSEILKNKRLKGALKSEEATMVCWSLQKRGYLCATKLSRCVSRSPQSFDSLLTMFEMGSAGSRETNLLSRREDRAGSLQRE